MKTLKKGDFIVIKFGKKLAHAKVINPPNQLERMNVFTQGTLKWIDAADFVRMGEKGASLKKGDFITNSENLKASKPGSIHVEMNDKKIPLSGKTVRIENESSMASVLDEPEPENKLEHGAYPGPKKTAPKISITTDDETLLAECKKRDVFNVTELSDAIGKSTPATKHMVDRLVSLGWIEAIDDNSFGITKAGASHKPGAAKPKTEIKKLKTDKKSGEVSVSKREQILTLLKDPEMTVKMIQDKTGAAPSYIRGIRERNAKKMDIPEEGSLKRKVFDELRLGGTLVDVAKRCKVTVSYAYQIKQQMQAAKII